jgi:mannan endo-1,4-beta-mannosidase
MTMVRMDFSIHAIMGLTKSGGMDAYVRRWGGSLLHDEFYTNQQILDEFTTYTTTIVTRYMNSPAIFSWEIANDPR